MKTLTSFIMGTVLLVGTALAAQTATGDKPAASSSSAPQSAGVKKVVHNKKKHSKHAKTVSKKSAMPVTPVAATKK